MEAILWPTTRDGVKGTQTILNICVPFIYSLNEVWRKGKIPDTYVGKLLRPAWNVVIRPDRRIV